jgi:hypothetical protein
MTQTERCRMLESSLPVAPYRAKLKALHDEMLAEIEALEADAKKFHEAASCERDVRQQLERTIEADEALLKQALNALEWYATNYWRPEGVDNTLAALRERLGETT